jgi:hypothetical protein
MRRLWLAWMSCAPALAAISGNVVNGSTGELVPGAVIRLYEMGPNGPAEAARARAGPRGEFAIDREVAGPRFLRTVFDGVAYDCALPMGPPEGGVTLVVYRSSKDPAAARLASHTVSAERAAGRTIVHERYIYVNEGTTTWNDPRDGTLRFHVPPAAGGEIAVQATPPGGAPLEQAAEKGPQPGTWRVPYPVRPGETRFDVRYSVPQEVAAALPLSRGPPPAAVADEDPGENPDRGGPQLDQIPPRIYRRGPLLVAMMLTIFAAGFVRLYLRGD